MSDLLRQQRFGSVRHCLVHQAWPQRDGSFLVAYELAGPGGRRLFTGELFGNARGHAAWEKARLRGEPVAYVPALDMVLTPFPSDVRLPHLELALDGAAMADVFRWALRDVLGPVHACGARLVAYRPGRRAVFRYVVTADRDRRHVLYGKAHRDDRGEDAFGLLRRLWQGPLGPVAGGAVTIARPMSYIRELGMVVQEEADGRSFFHLLSHRRIADYSVHVGTALARIHQLWLGEMPVHRSRDELEVLGRWMAAARAFVPALEPRLARLGDALGEWDAGAGSSHRVVSHRDFYDKQALLRRGRITVLDFDTLAWAEPALDIGNFLAHVTLRILQGLIPAGAAERAEESFLRGYQATSGPVEADRIAFYRAATLARLSCVYALRPRWAAISSSLVAESERLIGLHAA